MCFGYHLGECCNLCLGLPTCLLPRAVHIGKSSSRVTLTSQALQQPQRLRRPHVFRASSLADVSLEGIQRHVLHQACWALQTFGDANGPGPFRLECKSVEAESYIRLQQEVITWM